MRCKLCHAPAPTINGRPAFALQHGERIAALCLRCIQLDVPAHEGLFRELREHEPQFISQRRTVPAMSQESHEAKEELRLRMIEAQRAKQALPPQPSESPATPGENRDDAEREQDDRTAPVRR